MHQNTSGSRPALGHVEKTILIRRISIVSAVVSVLIEVVTKKLNTNSLKIIKNRPTQAAMKVQALSHKETRGYTIKSRPTCQGYIRGRI